MTTAATEKRKRAERPPQERVLRTTGFGLLRDATDDEAGDGQTLDGYAAVFNVETLIDSWEGRFWEKISNGSMKKSFREAPPIIQFDHGHHPLIGSIPIAELSSVAEETHPELAPDGGAHVIGRLMDNWLIQPVRDAIAARSIKGMSFRFGIVREKWYDPDGKEIKDEEELRRLLFESWWNDLPEDELLHRDLKELRVPELGPVVWPAYEATSVSVRSKTIDLGRLNEPEQRDLLAQAVFLADAAARKTEAPEVTADQAADNHPSETSQDAPRSTEPEGSAGEHPSDDDAPRSTEPDGSAGEHPSNVDPSPTDDIDAARTAERERSIDAALAEVEAARGITLI